MSKANLALGAAISSSAALGVIIVVSKLVQLSLWYSRFVPTGRLVLFLCIAALSLVAVATLFFRWVNRANFWRSLAVTLLSAVVISEISAFVVTGRFHSISFRLASIFVWDLCFLFSFGVVAFEIGRRGLFWFIWIATYLFACTAIADLALYVVAGSSASWLLLEYVFSDWAFVAQPIFVEVGYLGLAIFLLPLAVTIVSWRLQRPLSVRSLRLLGPIRRPIRFQAPVAILLFASALLWPADGLPNAYRANISNVFIDLIAEAISGRPLSVASAAELESRDVPFYSYPFELVENPNTQLQNVVLIIIESARAVSMPPQHREGVATPFLNSLAERSIMAEKMYTSVPFTAEALVAILHGVHPPSSAWSYYGSIHKPALPSLLKAAGYKTAFFTSAQLSSARSERTMLSNMGFDEVFDAGVLPHHGFEALRYSGYEDRILLEPTREWVSGVDGDQPYLLTVLTQQSHHDYRVPSWFETKDFGTGDEDLEAYLNALSYTDQVVEEMFTAFEEEGLIKNTLFVIVGDHGEGFGEHGVRFHGHHVWEEAITVPFMIYDCCASGEGSILTGRHQLVDVMPTILDLLDLWPEGVPRDLSMVTGKSGRDKVYVPGSLDQSMALITDSLKYIYSFRRLPLMAFDLAKDPFEKHDVAYRLPPGTAAEVEREVLSWQQEVNRRFFGD